MKKALLVITGIQRSGDEKEEIELTTVGTIREDDKAYIINYTEEEHDSPDRASKINLRIAKDNSFVNMTRSGPFGSCLIIEKGIRNQCHYHTEVGELLMGIHGLEIETDIEDGGGSFSFTYDIDFNGAAASRNTVIVNFTVK